MTDFLRGASVPHEETGAAERRWPSHASGEDEQGVPQGRQPRVTRADMPGAVSVHCATRPRSGKE